MWTYFKLGIDRVNDYKMGKTIIVSTVSGVGSGVARIGSRKTTVHLKISPSL